MPQRPIGITFLPGQEQAMEGPKRAGLEGDLGQAFRILSLRLPRVLGARSIAPPGLLNAPGAAGAIPPALGGPPPPGPSAPSGVNPASAVFEALLRAMAQGAPMGGGMGPPTPRVIPGTEEPPRRFEPPTMDRSMPEGPAPTLPERRMNQAPRGPRQRFGLDPYGEF